METGQNADRRTFLKSTGAVAAAGLAGCTSDTENNPSETESNTPEETRTTFEELYSEAERKPITGRTPSQNTGPLDLDEVEEMLSSDNSEAENVAIAATQASQHTRGREDVPKTIRYVLDELGLNAYADDRTAYSGGEVTITEIYAENNDGSVQKVMVTKVPHNTDIPLQYSLIAGEEPGEGDGAVADNNLHAMWDEDALVNVAGLDARAWLAASEEWGNPESNWEGVDKANDNYILGDSHGDAEIAYSFEGAQFIAELEDIDNSDHSEAFEAFKEINEFYANDVPEGEHMIIDAEGGELNLHTVGEDQYEEAVQGLNYEP